MILKVTYISLLDTSCNSIHSFDIFISWLGFIVKRHQRTRTYQNRIWNHDTEGSKHNKIKEDYTDTSLFSNTETPFSLNIIFSQPCTCCPPSSLMEASTRSMKDSPSNTLEHHRHFHLPKFFLTQYNDLITYQECGENSMIISEFGDFETICVKAWW